jgi:hypothetical protein
LTRREEKVNMKKMKTINKREKQFSLSLDYIFTFDFSEMGGKLEEIIFITRRWV